MTKRRRLSYSGRYNTTTARNGFSRARRIATDAAGYAAAGTLGFIANNIPGAVEGLHAYTQYRNWRDRMAPITPPRTPGNRMAVDTMNTTQSAGSHNSATKQHITIIVNPPRPLGKNLGKWSYYNMCSGYVKNTVGKQEAKDMFGVCTLAQLIGPNVTPTPTGNYWTLADNLFSLDPYQKTTGGSASWNTAQIPKSNKIFVKRVRGDIQIVNTSTLAVDFDLLFFKARCHQKTSEGFTQPSWTWNNALDQYNLGQGSSAWPADKTSSAVGGTSTYYDYGRSPMSERMFNRKWKKIARRTFILDGGQAIKYLYTMEMNRVYDREYLNSVTDQGLDILAGSIYVMLIERPTPAVTAIGSEPGADRHPSIGSASAAWTSTQEYELFSVEGPQVTYDRTIPNMISFTVDSNHRQYQINDVDNIGQIQNLLPTSAP